METHVPIVCCWLEHSYEDISQKESLIGYFTDIFSSVYTFNLSTIFEYNRLIKGMNQPIKYTLIYNSHNYSLLKERDLIHR